MVVCPDCGWVALDVRGFAGEKQIYTLVKYCQVSDDGALCYRHG